MLDEGLESWGRQRPHSMFGYFIRGALAPPLKGLCLQEQADIYMSTVAAPLGGTIAVSEPLEQ
jgi:hypothetical protein